MLIRNTEFDFDILRAADAERFERAAHAMQDTAARLPKDSLSGIIKGTCAMIDAFLADVLGEDYDVRLGLDVENLREMQAVYHEVLAAAADAQKELQSFGAAQTVAGVDVKARAAAAAKTAAASLPKPAEPLDWGDPTAAAAEAKPAGAIGEAAPGPVAFPLAAAQPTPQPPVDFAHMNRAQRRAYIKSLTGRK